MGSVYHVHVRHILAYEAMKQNLSHFKESQGAESQL